MAARRARVLWLLAAGAGLIGIALVAKRKVDTAAKEPSKLPPRKGHVTPGSREPFMALVRRAARRHRELRESAPGGNPVALLGGLLQHESSWDPLAESPTGALGLGQFTGAGRAEVRRLVNEEEDLRLRFRDTPGLAAKLGALTRRDMTAPELAVEAAALLLTGNLRRRRGHVEAALTEYNAGGAAAGLVVQHGTHAAAKPSLERLGPKEKSQSPTYAPRVLVEVSKLRAAGVA